MIISDTNDNVVVRKVKNGTVKLDISFNLLGNNYKINKATFGTGCAHSLISINMLGLDASTIKRLIKILYMILT